MDALSMLFERIRSRITAGKPALPGGRRHWWVILGAIPGLSATMAIALVIPLTYYLTPPSPSSCCWPPITPAPLAALCRPSSSAPRHSIRRGHRDRRIRPGKQGQGAQGH